MIPTTNVHVDTCRLLSIEETQLDLLVWGLKAPNFGRSCHELSAANAITLGITHVTLTI